MEKDQPPPYSAAMATHPLPGFTAPSSQPQSQAYPPSEGQPYPTPGAPPYPPQGQPPYPQGQPPYPQGQPYPQQGYAPLPQAGYTIGPGTTTVVVQTAPATFGPVPQPVMCPHCHQQIQSKIETEANLRTHLIALFCCLMGCIPCCLFPYCMDSCQSQNHYCPSCGAFLGTYNNDMGRRGW